MQNVKIMPCLKFYNLHLRHWAFYKGIKDPYNIQFGICIISGIILKTGWINQVHIICVAINSRGSGYTGKLDSPIPPRFTG